MSLLFWLSTESFLCSNVYFISVYCVFVEVSKLSKFPQEWIKADYISNSLPVPSYCVLPTAKSTP